MSKEKKYKQELQKSLEILKEEKILLYPTDTLWAIGCDITSKKAINKIYQIKKRDLSKPMILLVETFERLQTLVEMPSKAKEMILAYPKPLTLIYDKLKEKSNTFFENITSLAIRLTKDSFCCDLIKKLDSPIISTSANFSNYKAPYCFDEIDPLVLQKVDYVVDLSKEKISNEASTILKISLDNKLQLIRK